ncbi:phage fiber-tail adaptor protein [Pacificimonas sp. ICDLI1SI03]
MGFYLKSPGSSIDYAVDWGAGYLEDEQIVGSSWRVEPDDAGGLVIGATVTGPQRTAATLSGGTEGAVYRIVNSIELSDGRQDERSLTIRIEER